MRLPLPRGPLSAQLCAAFAAPPTPVSLPAAPPVAAPADPIADDDLQLALWCSYEMHYRGFDEVAAAWEWEPSHLAFRRQLESCLLDALRPTVAVPYSDAATPDRLTSLVAGDNGPPLSRYVQY